MTYINRVPFVHELVIFEPKVQSKCSEYDVFQLWMNNNELLV